MSDKPNFLVFFTDQQRWDTTGVHGCPLDLTPNFDRMAREGTHVAHSYTCQPVCGPARSCLQTGRYATETGCWRNGIPLPTDAKALGHYFRDAGYDTGYIGKWHLGDGKSNGPVRPEQRGGYDYWLAANAIEMTSDAYETTVWDNDQKPVHLPGYRVDALTDAAIRFISQPREKPFFLFLSFLEPHHQNHRDDYPAPHGYAERYIGKWAPPDLESLKGNAPQQLAGYFGMVKRLDEALGRVRDALFSLGKEDETVLLYSADHGNHFKTRNAEYKRSCHDASLRVPTALYGPGFTGGGEIRDLVSLIDLPPTLLDAAGISAPSTMHGRSLLPLTRGERKDWPTEVFAQISEAQVGRCVRTKRWKYSVSDPTKNGNRDSHSDHYTEEFLYDLQADPYELTNLIAYDSHAEVRAILRARLLHRLAEAGEPTPEIVPAPGDPIKGGQRRVSAAEARS